ncbi:MAG TPA: hypothetical protein DHV37_05910 [Erysipelotrichaceae bacterium]|nr:hypothetical protein [Erysipelotrichaceae bacterium]
MKSSISRIKLFKACRRAYYFKYIQDLEPVQRSEALTIGSNYHDLIEELYTNGGFVTPNDFSKERAMAVAYKRYIYPKFKVRSVEQWKEKPVGRHILFGRVDGIAEDGCLVEHKTTSMSDITEAYEYELLWDEQILAYMYLTGTRKVYYTVCRKPTIRQRKDEDEEGFYNRMLDWYDEDTNEKIRVMEITRTDEEVKEFIEEFTAMCDSMEAVENGNERCYRNNQYCNCWGRRCEYSSICLNYNPEQEYVEFIKGGRKQ